MQRFSNVNQAEFINKDFSFWANFLGNGVMLAVLAIALLYSSGGLAEGNDLSSDDQLVLNNDETVYQTKVKINNSKITSEDMKKISVKDTQIGAFSIEDGAMMGHYGDGEYAD